MTGTDPGTRPSRTAPRTRRSREVRIHWLIIFLGMVVLFGSLLFDGYVSRIGSDGSTQYRVAGEPSGQAAQRLMSAGPVVSMTGPDQVRSWSMPERTIGLTFNDGPDPQWTPQILDLLARYQVHATFFVVGAKVNQHPELVRRMVAEGHEVGIQTFTHADLTGLPAWRRHLEISLAQQAVVAATGRQVGMLRPPYSSGVWETDEAAVPMLADTARRGYLLVFSDRDTRDYEAGDAWGIAHSAKPRDRAGAVVTMRDAGQDRSRTVDAVERLLTGREQGDYQVTSVGRAIGLPAAGTAGRLSVIGATALCWAQGSVGVVVAATSIMVGLWLCLAVLRIALQVWCAFRHASRTGDRYPPVDLGLISVVVPAFNEAGTIEATVRSLVANDYPRFEVIVVDDGSTDGTGEIVERMALAEVRVIRQPNAGKSQALNTGIASARSDLLVLVDADTVLETDAITNLVKRLADPRVGAVSGNTKVLNRGGLIGRLQHIEYVVGFNLDRRVFDVAACMPTVPGAIGAFRREAITGVGGLSGATLAEDTDLTMAVVRAGWRVVYADMAVAWTNAPTTVPDLWRQRRRWCYGTMQAMWKHRRAVVEAGASGALGRRGVCYVFLYQVLMPMCGPAIDVYAVYALVTGSWQRLVVFSAILLVVQTLAAALALCFDGESYTALATLPLHHLLYRPMLYMIVLQSTQMALAGTAHRWDGSVAQNRT